MSIQSVLALIDGGATSVHAVKAAIDVGTAFDAYVEVLHVEAPVSPYVPAMAEGVGIAGAVQLADDLMADVKSKTEHARQLFDTHCVDGGLNVVEPGIELSGETSFAWRLVNGHDNPELARRGRLFDLIVMARPDEAEGGVDSAVLEAALFDTGRPVLIAGQSNFKMAASHMAIAWDGSREATHSVGAALPFLRKAESVTAISVGDRSEPEGLTDLAAYLRRHGIMPETHCVERRDRSVAEILHHEIREQSVGLTVMGAYGHSMVSEYLFGGVTRDMLKDREFPLFLAH